MKDLVRIFKSPEGDVYHIALSEDKGVLSQEVLESLGNVHVVGIELRRLAGRNTTGHDVLAALDGTMRKLIDVSKLHSLGWTHKVEIEEGVAKLFQWYKESLQ